MKIIVVVLLLLLVMILSKTFMARCNYEVVSKINTDHKLSNIVTAKNDVYVITESTYGIGERHDVFEIANNNSSFVYNIKDMSDEVAKIKGGYFNCVTAIDNRIYGLATVFDTQTRKTFSKLYELRPSVKEVAVFKGVKNGMVSSEGGTLYIWDRNSVFKINATNGKILNEYSDLSIDTNNSNPVSDASGVLHLISSDSYFTIVKGEIKKINTGFKNVRATAVDGETLYVLSALNSEMKILIAESGKELSNLKSSGLPVLFYKNKNKIAVVVSNNTAFSTDKTILTSVDGGNRWKKCNLNVSSKIGITKDEELVLMLRYDDEIAKMPLFK